MTQKNEGWIALISLVVGLTGIGIISWKISTDNKRHQELLARIEAGKDKI